MAQDENKGAGPGVFITFEGGEGAGKTTHINFLAKALRGLGKEVLCVREPGGTPIGEALRKVVLDAANEKMADETELLIYEAARAQLVSEVIAPALAANKVVLCDRFCDSTIAYQVHGRGLPLEFVQRANNFACQGVRPDRTILMVTGSSVEDGLERATHHGYADRLELAGSAFHSDVNDAFEQMALADPDRIKVVCSATGKPETAHAVFAALADLFDWEDLDALFPATFFEDINRTKTDVKASIVANG